MTDFKSALAELSREVKIRENEPLSLHSTFKIGGAARYFVLPETDEQLIAVLRAQKTAGEPYIIIGNGSNILFSDRGFDGVVISTCAMKDILTDGNKITALCGASVIRVATEARKNGLSGLEFAYGIPGTVGGCVSMNAGAYGGQMSDVVFETKCYDIALDKVFSLTSEQQDFGYRHTVFTDHPEYVVLSSSFELHPDDPDEIQARMSDYMGRRQDKQPLEFPSAGSVFKRPEGHFAGKLIEDCDLKGFSVGGAQVSEKHAGFIINRGGATSEDVITLIKHIKKTVFDRFGIMLECEVKLVGDR